MNNVHQCLFQDSNTGGELREDICILGIIYHRSQHFRGKTKNFGGHFTLNNLKQTLMYIVLHEIEVLPFYGTFIYHCIHIVVYWCTNCFTNKLNVTVWGRNTTKQILSSHGSCRRSYTFKYVIRPLNVCMYQFLQISSLGYVLCIQLHTYCIGSS